MSEFATVRIRMLPPARLERLLFAGSTVAAALGVLASYTPVSLLAVLPALAVALVLLVRQSIVDAEYRVDAAGVTERRARWRGGVPREHRWLWHEVRSYQLQRMSSGTPGGRNILVVRLPGGRLRLREPANAVGREAHARFVDRFVGYVTGDVAPGRAGEGLGESRDEAPHRKPLTTGEAPQLRRTLAHPAARRPAAPHAPAWPDRPVGRLASAAGALVIVGLTAAVAITGSVAWWHRMVVVALPAGLWLAWRALRGGDR